MNLVDLGHSLLTGSWRIQRDAVRELRAHNEKTRSKRELMAKGNEMRTQLYAGAEPGINRPYPNVLSTPEDYKQAYERIVLIRAAREMEEDYGFFDGLLDDFETYVVGDCLAYLPDTGNPDANKAIREYLEWQFDECDYSRRLDLTKLAQLLVRSMKRDGENGVMPVDTGESIKLRYYSGDLIGNPMIGANIGPNNFNGIITDEATEEVVEYRLYKRIPKLNAYFFDRSVPSDQFWHYYDPFRLQQYHGVSAFKNAIRDGFDMDQILEFAKLNMKFRASQLPVVHTETGRPRGAGIGWGFGTGYSGPGAPNPAGTPVNAAGIPQPMTVAVDGVTTTYLKLDEAVVDFPHDFPNAQLHVSVDELRRQCCKGAKLPMEFVFRSDAGGVTQRFWVNKAEQTFRKDRHLLRRTVLNRYKNRAIQKGIDTGFLDLDSFGNLSTDLARFRGTWQMGRPVSVDYGRETEADIKLVDAGLLSARDKVADLGANIDDVTKENEAHVQEIFEAAARIAKKTNQDIALVLPYLTKKFPNPGAGLTAAGAAGGVEAQTTKE